MTPETVGPLSRLVDVGNVPPAGKHVHVAATPEECAALAKDFGLAAIESLSADFTAHQHRQGRPCDGGGEGAASRRSASRAWNPSIPSSSETVEVDFAEPSGMPPEPPTEMHEYEPPDEIVNGKIDLGARHGRVPGARPRSLSPQAGRRFRLQGPGG